MLLYNHNKIITMNKFSTTSPNTMYSRVKNSPNKYKAVPERKIIGLNLKNPKI